MLWKKDQGGGEGRVLTYDIGDGGRLVARDEVVEEAHHDDAAIVYLRIDQWISPRRKRIHTGAPIQFGSAGQR